MKKILICAMAFLILFTACSNVSDDTDVAGSVKITVTTDTGEIILSEGNVAFAEKDTVYDILLKTCKSKKIALVSDGAKENAFVTGIDGLANMAKGPESFWIYRVNGENVPVGCGAYEVKDKDVIEWLYITSMEEFELK